MTEKGFDRKKRLDIKDAFKEDAGRGIIRIDPYIEAELNLRTGDVIEISHTTEDMKTAALLYPGRKEDKGAYIIRIDPSLRRDINASIDDIVQIRKIKVILSEKSHKEYIELEKARVTYEDIGGLEEEIKKIREIIELPVRKKV